MTDNEIIKALECCTNQRDCCECAYFHDKPCIQLKLDALDLINRQQKNKEKLQKNILKYEEIFVKQQAEISVKRKLLEQAEETINKQQAEIERLQKHYHKVCEHTQKVEMELAEKELDTSWFNNPNTHLIAPVTRQIKSEAIKEFAERLKEKASKTKIVYVADTTIQEQEIGWYQISIEDLDNLVKEMTEPSLLDKKFGGEQG